MIRIKAIIKILIILLLFYSCKTTKNTAEVLVKTNPDVDIFRIMFYNVENLFDIENDPKTNDDEFTPQGSRYWTEYRYRQKLNNIYKVIVAVGEWNLPIIVGLAEIENRKVLNDLINKTPLYKSDYEIIHYNSPDNRGIDVGLLYSSKHFVPISHKPIPVKWSDTTRTSKTRDILYVCGVSDNKDTLHLFVNHWPSRSGGQIETEDLRMDVAGILKNYTDTILAENPVAKIVIMGDLNDYPTDRSLVEALNAETNYDEIKPKNLYNLSYYLQEVKNRGTYKYGGQWGILDQIIISGTLLDTTNTTYTTIDNVYVYSAEFLLEKDEQYAGHKPNRTYVGYKYNSGYSDHLPTYVDIIRK
jgi:predicted extracellular nuclease